MERNKFIGMGVALVTPFKTDGSVDFSALARLVDYQLKNGTDYLVVLGTTAETPTLSAEEQLEITQFIVEKVNGKLPIVLGMGGNDTRALVQKISTANLNGVDAILSVTPYYNKPTQEGIYQHYAAVAKSTKLPIILYNVPGRTGVNMSVETTLRLANDFSNIIATKEASGNIAQVDAIIKNKPKDFLVISGDDAITFPLITLGASGVISVIGNAFPCEFSKMVRLALAGDYQTALTIHHGFTELIELLFVDGNPAGVKSILSAMGYLENQLRLPLLPTRITTYEKMRNILLNMNIKC
ncbi:MAG: 4-hydroxy-tetrahydrodipicolinate synthase [Paludibacteraceae bacterium]|jgi:4-hydroxy-tetrahydrodipicolinate synthase|nr:4-hydroxy-tetrahydrodipicolinate synthase [Paludibacteraceae bacterium]NLK93188.1 4-hydroxy-tetrahydrodipicolinate synthase [Bacteroidales bacterium]MBP6436205.1 4-hydroxy-tetrahydrodipicolinate synthase [Paludibacteraceae bacterium]MBP7219694.1 4-hydroxy-tetrahydrodipicolinate synthase [Paludibacteraceae bacterium]MBP8626964.1 4-hydroxy-tetrahydrodipicolinate synthase [Paludibacteraceae bacterium]